MAVIINALLPTLVTLLIGYLAAWHHGNNDGKFSTALNSMVMTYTLPLSLFAGLVTTSRDSLAASLPMFAGVLGAMAIPYVVVLFVARHIFHRNFGESIMQATAVALPAIAFTGLPVLGAIFGPADATITVAIGGLISNVLIVPTTLVLLSLATANQNGNKTEPVRSRAQQQRQPANAAAHDVRADKTKSCMGEASKAASVPSTGSVILSALKEPLVWAPLLAIAIVLVGIKVPTPLDKSLALLGSTTAGVILFASGLILQAQQPTISWPIVATIVLRLVAVPVAAFLLFQLCGLDAKARHESVIALSMPCGALLVVLATRFHVSERENSSVLLWTNILAIPAMAAAIAFTG